MDGKIVAAYNWILFDVACPACGKVARIEAQTHVASSFDGDQSGRFCHRDYRLGETIAWWPRNDDQFASWAESADPSRPEVVTEACYATCTACARKLYAVVEFDGLVVRRVSEVGLEADWPRGLQR
jgi:hypothetical protein